MTKTPISRKTLREQVAEILRKKILNGDIQSGERIVEADLARELQMSRGAGSGGATSNRGRGFGCLRASQGLCRQDDDV